MDRCRCEDYKHAVEKLKFYTCGTYRPDIIENFDKTGYTVGWVTNGISHSDMRFVRPKSRRVLTPQELAKYVLPHESRKIEQMWCPFMSPVDRSNLAEHH